MRDMEFMIGNVNVEIVSTKLPDGRFDVRVNATGEKAEVEEVMRSIVTGSLDLNLLPELGIGKVGETMVPLKVSELMGGN